MENDIVGIITENENKGKTTGLGEIGSRLQNKYPDFDVRNYGYSLLSKFLDEIPSLELVKEGHTVLVRLHSDAKASAEVEHWMADTVRAAGERGLSLSELGNQLHTAFRISTCGITGIPSSPSLCRASPVWSWAAAAASTRCIGWNKRAAAS